jgi:hypothetical protein
LVVAYLFPHNTSDRPGIVHIAARKQAGELIKIVVSEERHSDASLDRLWRLRHNTPWILPATPRRDPTRPNPPRRQTVRGSALGLRPPYPIVRTVGRCTLAPDIDPPPVSQHPLGTGKPSAVFLRRDLSEHPSPNRARTKQRGIIFLTVRGYALLVVEPFCVPRPLTKYANARND